MDRLFSVESWKRRVLEALRARGAPNRVESNKLLLSHTLDELFSDYVFGMPVSRLEVPNRGS
jgi:hypothetical protein